MLYFVRRKILKTEHLYTATIKGKTSKGMKLIWTAFAAGQKAYCDLLENRNDNGNNDYLCDR